MFGSGSSQVRVLLASVLKPVDDTRMRGKFAETLRERPAVHVHIAGRATVKSATRQAEPGPQITQHPIFQGSRLSLNRLLAQWHYWRLLHNLRPTLVIVHAPELLPLTLLWQALGLGRKFLYDIRENYALNVSTQGVYQGLIRRILAATLRWVESKAAHRAGGVILAEASYAHELPFLLDLPAGRVAVLENKYQPAPGEILPTQPRPLPGPNEPLQLLYSGTISSLNGIREAVMLTEKLNTLRHGGAFLTVIGFCQQPDLLGNLLSWEAQGLPLRVIGGSSPVPHAAIVAEIGRSHLGLALYHPHPSTAHCRPTKLFEYLAYGLPVLVPENPLWQSLLEQHDAGLSVDLAMMELPPDDENLLTALAERAQRTGPAFYQHGIPTDVLWTSEGKKLWHLLDTAF